MRKRTLIIGLLLLSCRFMVLPTMQYDRCATAVESWHFKRVAGINAMSVDNAIKAQMIDFSSQEANRQLSEICQQDPTRPLAKQP